MRVDITALYCCLDDFVGLYEEREPHQLIDTGRKGNVPKDVEIGVAALPALSV